MLLITVVVNILVISITLKICIIPVPDFIVSSDNDRADTRNIAESVKHPHQFPVIFDHFDLIDDHRCIFVLNPKFFRYLACNSERSREQEKRCHYDDNYHR